MIAANILIGLGIVLILVGIVGLVIGLVRRGPKKEEPPPGPAAKD